jgi:vancomycin resistance protein VanJ
VYFPLGFYALLCGVGLLVAWWVGASRRVLLIGVLAALGVNVLLDCRVVPAGAGGIGGTGQSFQVLSYNLHQAHWANAEIMALVRSQMPDVLLFQEAPPSFFEMHEAELRTLFRNVHYSHYLLTATNFDVVASETIFLPFARCLHRVRIHRDGGDLELFNTHLTVVRPRTWFGRMIEQRHQVAQVLEHLKAADCPVLIGGDFNFPPHCTLYREIAAVCPSVRSAVGFGFGYTFPSFFPLVAIDHFFASPSVRFLDFQVVPALLSDHRPVTCRVEIDRP